MNISSSVRPYRAQVLPKRKTRILITSTMALLAGILTTAGPPLAMAQCPAANCPPITKPQEPNLLANPKFDTFVCASTWWQAGIGNCGTLAAATSWRVHSSNSGQYIATTSIPSTLPAEMGGGGRMVHIRARGNESGLWQPLPAGLKKVVASVWVKVMHGHVVLQAHGGSGGPASWSTKTGQWEQLRVCTDGSTPVGMLIVWNQDPAGGDFFIEAAELKVVP